ncbi:cytochrome P450 CYP82D47-like [Magnolia sinica]|uniref:cytochrome P450 CYP82D47-like n=1 Tax=Magnolia sinica TaxID=86752 RepID=UPI002658E64A|nr:cytochrome P450 CYP82D47-like [Magnolia sinica]
MLLQALLALFALLFSYKLCIARSKSKKTRRIEPPEPPSAWPVIGHLRLLGGPQPFHQTAAAMADKYGPIFMLRLGIHPTLVVSSWEVVKECFTTNDKVLATRPNTAAGKYMCYDNSMFGMAPYGPYWRSMRKITTVHLLSNARLDALKHIQDREIDAHVKMLYGLWAKNDGGPVLVGMRNWFGDLTFDVVVTMVVGKRFGTDGADGESRRFRNVIDRFLQYILMFIASDLLPFTEWMDWKGHKRGMKRVAEELDSIISVYLEEHRRKRLSDGAHSDQDFMDVMLSIIDDDEFSSYDPDTTIKATTLSLIIGGTDTSAVNLAVALSFILNNPHVLKKAQDELDIHVGKDRHVDESDIRNLVYLQAILKETLRLSPVSTFLPLHEAMEDCQLGGFHVPAGTRVLVNSWKVHRDPRVWPDPLVFRPERFLTSHVNVDVRGQQFEYIPFGSGRRSCSGVSFAMQVMHLTLARVLHGFEPARPSDAAMDIESLTVGNPKSTAVEVLLSPRLRSDLYE